MNVVFVTRELPYSEVCMFMRVAGTRMQVEPLASGMAQLWRDGSKFSFPITWGEAGISHCATIGCSYSGRQVIEHGPANERTREVVCDECAQSYLRRPALAASTV